MSTLSTRLGQVRVAEPQEAGGLQVFGLFWEPATALDYQTLDEGLTAGTLEVTEVSEGGSVPTLRVHNKSGKMTFLMVGEQLVGAKQNRVLNASILVAPESELPIPVSCVEQGRWAYRSRSFGSSGTSSHSKLRRSMHDSTTCSYRSEGRPQADQSAVWGEVARKTCSMETPSDTMAMEDTYLHHRASLSEVVDHLHVPEGACGVVFVYNGRVAGVDLFDQAATLLRLWPKVLRAYAIDVLEDRREDAPRLTPAEVGEWLQSVVGAKEETFKSPGLGDDIRLTGDRLVGASLMLDEQPVHVELFPSMPA
jgi:hypothetical protein